MKISYLDLIEQTHCFPQEEFALRQNNLQFHGIDIMQLIEQYGTPFKLTYLPKIQLQIEKAKKYFNTAISDLSYQGTYNYAYCTKSAHFSFILEEVLRHNVHLETSSAFDLNIVEKLFLQGQVSKKQYILCNGFKPYPYIQNIAHFINAGFYNTIPILDNLGEIDLLDGQVSKECDIGIRIASEEEPTFQFYTSRLGISYKDIIPFYLQKIEPNPKFNLRMIHFFINTGIKDNAYYWTELSKSVEVYIALKKMCPALDSINIGGGFPIKLSLTFRYDYETMVRDIVTQIKTMCADAGVPDPHIFTEFGNFTVGESGAAVYSILDQKRQNDREKWNMIDSSFLTTLPDTWGLNQRFLLLAINHWDKDYERVLLGGLTCDSSDYYNSEAHVNAVYLPKYKRDRPQYIGFFHTGAYQESVGGYGGLQHCLIPCPKHIIANKNEAGDLVYKVFSSEQKSEEMLSLLGY